MLAGIAVCPAQDNGSQEITRDLDKYIRQAMEQLGTPGVSAGIIKDGKIIYLKGFGYANTSTQTAVTPQTLFAIASCSKAFTAAATAMLVEDKKLSWDTPVTGIDTAFALADPCYTSQMKIADLLCHRSGLQTFDGDMLWYGTDYTQEEIVRRIGYRELMYGIREKFGYQNVMYIEAARIIAMVSGRPWDEYLRERFFNPLGMTRTLTSFAEVNRAENVAAPHLNGKPVPLVNYDNSWGAAGIVSSAEDLLKWVAMWLNNGVSGDSVILSPESIQTLTGAWTPLPVSKSAADEGTHFSAYGLGWFISDFAGVKVIQHSGGLPGYHSKVVLIPELNAGYVILANQIGMAVDAIHTEILGRITDRNKTDRLSDYVSIAERIEQMRSDQEQGIINRHDPESVDRELFNRIDGVYEDRMYGPAEITTVNGQSTLRLIPSGDILAGLLEPWYEKSAKIRFNDQYLPTGLVHFETTKDSIKGFTIELENPDFHFEKLYFGKQR
ncbi:MAG: serine hydrolase [Bacteroidales bacterium]